MADTTHEHGGHRQRMRRRIKAAGLDGLADHEVLEVLLYFALPRGDTNALAHRLLNHFGSLSQVLEAAPEDLQKLEGIGENAAFVLSLMPGLAARYLRDKNRRRPVFGGTEAFTRYVVDLFAAENREVAYMLCLNGNLQLLHTIRLSEGSLASVEVPVSLVVERALQAKARGVVLAHNHPSGRQKVSHEDFELTKRCIKALDCVNIKLLDHLVVCGNTYISFRECKYMEPLRKLALGDA